MPMMAEKRNERIVKSSYESAKAVMKCWWHMLDGEKLIKADHASES